MCGRARAASAAEVRGAAAEIRRRGRHGQESSSSQTSGGPSSFEEEYSPSPNAHPGRQLGVVVKGASIEARPLTWGLGAHKWRSFNARSETAHRLPSFRKLYGSRRGVAVLSGFYEWTDGALKQKQPHYAHRDDGEALLVAALYDEAGGCTLLTRDVVPELAWLHDRMPVIFPDAEAARRWLDHDASKGAVFAFPAPPPNLATYPVDPKMSRLAYQQNDASEPMKPPAKVTDFFKKQITQKLSAPTSIDKDHDDDDKRQKEDKTNLPPVTTTTGKVKRSADKAPASSSPTKKKPKPAPSKKGTTLPPSKKKKKAPAPPASPPITNFFKKIEKK
mmetsp:Transcript_13125/g.42772  ORF Transcript_13125/g.42772 Transcript_13125/m.42772 type:complete len:333 (-) Transcript_13125:131-1129(-)